MSALEQLNAAELTQLDQGGELWSLYRQAGAESLFFFSKAIFTQIPNERNLLSISCHLPLCLLLEEINKGTINRALIEDPRRHCKSTLVTKNRPTHKLVQRVVSGLDPCDRFALYSSTVGNSQRFWRETKGEYEANEFFQFLYPELIPNFKDVTGWGSFEGTVPRHYNPKEPTFDCLGGGKATSRHYDDITLDDLVNEENYDSPTALEKSYEYFTQAENLLDNPNGTIVVVGNRWGMTDVNHRIHLEQPDFAVFSRSCYGPRLKYRLSTGARYHSRHLPEPVMELLAKMPDGEPIWPEKFDKEELGRILAREKPRVFTAQYLNNPSDPDNVDFRLEWLKDCEFVTYEGKGYLKYCDDPEPLPINDLNFYITWDPALDGKQSSSRNAILVTTIDCRGRICVFRDYAKKCDPLESLDAFIEFARTYKGYLKGSGVEEILFQKVLGTLLVNRAKDQGVALSIRKLKTPKGGGKDQRIRAWIGTLFEDGRVYVRGGCNLFIEEYAHFGVEGMTRDLMDAFAYATQLWQRPMNIVEKDKMERMAQLARVNRGMTGYGTALAP